MSLSFRPTAPQWRLMNLLSQRALFTASREAGVMLRKANAAAFELEPLIESAFVALEVDGKPVAVQYDAVQPSKAPDGASLRLLAAGIAWVSESPWSKAIVFLARSGSRWTPVRKVLAGADVDLEAVWNLNALGQFVEITDEMGCDAGTYQRLRAALDEYKVALTRKGDSVIS